FGGAIDTVRIDGNEIVEFEGHGIMVLAASQSSIVHQNRVSRVALDGILLLGWRGGAASITDNVVREIGYNSEKQRHVLTADRRWLAGIAVGAVQDADVRANQVLGVRSLYASQVAGIYVE